MIPEPNRRQLLKFGAALPLAINSLRTRAVESQKNRPQRIIFICNSLGFYRRNFVPTEQGELGSSRYLKHLKTQDKVTVFDKFYHPGMDTSNHDSEKSFLTGAPNPEATGFVNSISVDQLIAQKQGNQTRFPAIGMSIYDRGWGCSWNDRGSAIPPMHDEEKIFDMLFGDEDLRAKKQQISNDQKILESLRRDLKRLTTEQTAKDQYSHYESLIREMETQLEHETFWLNTKKPKVSKSLSEDREFEFSTKIHNLFELSKLALRTDSTRVITLSLDWIYGAIKVPGATGGWHTLSHHGGRGDALKDLSLIETDIIKHFNQFLVDLDQIKDGAGTLLDQTTVVMGSNFGDASNHTCKNLPIIVAGGGFKHRQFHALDRPNPLCNLWLELLHRNNIDLGKFGTSEKDFKLLGG